MLPSFFEGRVYRGGCDLQDAAEDWQFENPILKVGEDGQVVSSRLKKPDRVKANPLEMKPISEVLGRVESKSKERINILSLPMDKQLELVAEAYNAGAKVYEMESKFNITMHALYRRIRMAHQKGLIPVMRGKGNNGPAMEEKGAVEVDIGGDQVGHNEDAVMVEADNIAPPRATVDDFVRRLEDAREKAERYSSQAEVLSQAVKIAQAVEELLGEKADRVLTVLLKEVAAS